MKIHEFERRVNAHGTYYLVRTREITPEFALSQLLDKEKLEALRDGRDVNNAATMKLVGIVAQLITLLPADKADEILDYAYDIEEGHGPTRKSTR